MYVTKAIQGDLEIKFPYPLEIVGRDEVDLYLADPMNRIGGLPYIIVLSGDWRFVEALTGRNILFEARID